jgi:hypothetical protein
MTPHAIEATYTEKLDRICEVLEELILNALIARLEKIPYGKSVILDYDHPRECYKADCSSRIEIPF